MTRKFWPAWFVRFERRNRRKIEMLAAFVLGFAAMWHLIT